LVRVLARAALLCFPARFRRACREDFVEASLHLLQRERADFVNYRRRMRQERAEDWARAIIDARKMAQS